MAENLIEDEDFDFEGKREETTFLVHMIAGSFAGLMEHVAMYPLDTIKVRIVINFLKKTHMQTSTKKTTFFGTLNTIYSNGGFSRFWKGSMIIGTASVPAHSLYFSVYEVCKKKFGVNNTV
jgi:solute carrier family 25 iron transporter 28/37